MASATGANGRVCLTTRGPSVAMETELRLRLTSRTLVSFFEGRVPCLRLAWTLRRSGQSFWICRQADLDVVEDVMN